MDWENARYLMVEQQIRPWNVLDKAILDRILATRREDFVPADKKDLALVDTELPLGNGGLMLAPKIEARLLQTAELKPTDKVLVIGAGAHYLIALAAGLCAQVHAVEPDAKEAERGNASLKAAGIRNAVISSGDVLATQAQAPFDAIIASGSVDEIPQTLIDQLAAEGRLVITVGHEPMMTVALIGRTGNAELTEAGIFEYNLPRLVTTEPVFEF